MSSAGSDDPGRTIRVPNPPPHRCGNCGHWNLHLRGGGVLGQCMVRPGRLPTFSGPNKACDVAHGRAWMIRGAA